MRTGRVLLIAATVAFPLVGRAQQTAAAPPAAPSAAQDVVVDPASKIQLHGMMKRLANTMAGERVVAVGWGGGGDDQWSDAEFRRCRTTLERLQMVSAEFSPKGGPDLIPFKVGGALAVAPETQQVPNPDLGLVDAYSGASRGTLITALLLGLPDDQLRQAGTAEGVAVAALPPDLRAAAMRAFRPPLRIVRLEPLSPSEAGGTARHGLRHEEVQRVSEEFDWSKARVRVCLHIGGASVPLGQEGAYIQAEEASEAMFKDDSYTERPWRDRATDLPIYTTAANAFKPSDLAGKRYTQPLNLSGVWKLPDVVARLSLTTGLKLKASVIYQDTPVFVGSPQVTAGEVLDALRLGLTASWRRLGDTYLLVWDRRGLGAIQQMIVEATRDTVQSVRKRRHDLENDPRWLELVMALPFAPGDPLALTPDQRQKLYGETGKGHRGWEKGIPWEEMTPDQQGYLSRQARLQEIPTGYGSRGAQPERRPFTDDDIRKARLDGSCEVRVSLQVPGVGWVRASDTWDVMRLSPWHVSSIRARVDPVERKRRMTEEMPPEIKELQDNPTPLELPSDVRAVMVPPLGAARLAVLASEMKRHGFTTLLYPALFGGYATFTSKCFPPHPSLRGADGLAAAVAAMKPAGIEVIPYLNTLTWQDEGANAHWLNKHPEWLDVDILGRPRLDWLRDHPGQVSGMEALGVWRANAVCAAVPEVEARLTALVREVGVRSGMAGVAFAQWNVGAFDWMDTDRPALPALGYSLADRVSAFRRYGIDPVDEVRPGGGYLPEGLSYAYAPRDLRGASSGEPNPHESLISHLVQTAHEARQGWKVWVIDEQPAALSGASRLGAEPEAKGAGKPDLAVDSILAVAMGGAGRRGAVLPVTRKNLFACLAEMDPTSYDAGDVPDALLTAPAMNVFAMVASGRGGQAPRLPAIVLDFRTAPELITPNMAHVKAPEKSVGGSVARPSLKQGDGNAGAHGK